MITKSTRKSIPVMLIGFALIAMIIIIGTIWAGHKAKQDTENAVNSVSLFYLDELAGRREQVVSSTLKKNISDLKKAVGLMTESDLSDIRHMQAYQTRMKKLYMLEKFAFVDTDGLIYTSLGIQDNINEYNIDYKTINAPEILLKTEKGNEKDVIIAVPVDDISLDDKQLVVCFMEIDMNTMLEGVSLQSDNNDTTFCNIYTRSGSALTNMVLGGLASEDNLLSALEQADLDEGSSSAKICNDFEKGQSGVVSFTYNGIKETLSYKPVDGTDWMLTYLIRESVISDKIGSVSNGIINRSLVMTILTAMVLFMMFIILLYQNRRASKIALEKESSEARNRIKQEELEHRLELQNQLLEQEKQRTQ